MQVVSNDITIAPSAVNIRHLIQNLNGVTQTNNSQCVYLISNSQPETCGHPRQTNNLALLQLMFFEISQPRSGLANFLRVHAKNVDNFRRNSFTCGKPEYTSTIFPLFQ